MVRSLLNRIHKPKPPRVPILVPLPGNGQHYVWPTDRILLGELHKAGERFYTQGDSQFPLGRVK